MSKVVFAFTSTSDKISNKYYLGPAPLEEMARQIATARGPNGYNRDYLFKLEKAMFNIGHEDFKVIELANAIFLVMYLFLRGSGSSYLYGFFDQVWKDGMTKDEAEQLVVKAVSLAIARDGASGGVVRTVIINADGVTRNFYPGYKLQLWHEELESRNSLLDMLNASSPEPMSM